MNDRFNEFKTVTSLKSLPFSQVMDSMG